MEEIARLWFESLQRHRAKQAESKRPLTQAVAQPATTAVASHVSGTDNVRPPGFYSNYGVPWVVAIKGVYDFVTSPEGPSCKRDFDSADGTPVQRIGMRMLDSKRDNDQEEGWDLYVTGASLTCSKPPKPFPGSGDGCWMYRWFADEGLPVPGIRADGPLYHVKAAKLLREFLLIGDVKSGIVGIVMGYFFPMLSL